MLSLCFSGCQWTPSALVVVLLDPVRPLQLHRADSDGDGSVQAAEEPEAEQRPRLLFPLPDPERPQVHSLSQRVAP